LVLKRASEYGHLDVVNVLIDHGADVHASDDYALHWASRYGHTDVVKLLLEHAGVLM
jgi:ankyrin repeat protein